MHKGMLTCSHAHKGKKGQVTFNSPGSVECSLHWKDEKEQVMSPTIAEISVAYHNGILFPETP